MAAQLDHADRYRLLRDRPCTATGCCVLSEEHTFSEEQKEMHVKCRSGVNWRPEMITVETQPRGGGHRDDDQEEEIQKVTNKHHQRGESSRQGHAVLVRFEVERLEAH